MGSGGDSPALLAHDEVLSLFHEPEHGLHRMLIKVSAVRAFSINGVA